MVAFSILNQSIDLDYLTHAFQATATTANYDDFDSITEYVIEQLLDDDSIVPDNDDDSDGMPKAKGLEKFAWNPLYFQHAHKSMVAANNGIDKASFSAWLQLGSVCRGYSHLFTPPPDAWVA